MLLRVLIIGSLSLAFSAAVADECSTVEAYAAETVVDYLDSWKNVHLAYTQFRKCDDAAIAEGLSDAVARLLANEWKSLSELVKLVAAEPQFGEFVLKHLDETIDDSDRRAIERHAAGRCPKDAADLCAKIRDRLKSLGAWHQGNAA